MQAGHDLNLPVSINTRGKRLLAQKKVNSLGQLNYFANLHLNLQVNPAALSPSSHTPKFG